MSAARGVFRDVDLHLRVARDKREDAVAKRSRRQRRVEADLEPARFAALSGPRTILHQFEFGKNPAGRLDELLTDRREVRATSRALEQKDAKPVLKLANALAQGRLRDIDRSCRAPEAAVLGCSNDIAKVRNFNAHTTANP